ncbi:MAG: HAD family hydrolase [Lachnospiraceae bacterium]|jgi:putative hydrolase of the HAD superfamily|nr:HAD family hydrolase [Lachnospiraceae bacterium]
MHENITSGMPATGIATGKPATGIDTIFFDVGNTLRIVLPEPEFRAKARADLYRLAGATEPEDVFFEKLTKNWDTFRKFAKTQLLDFSEMELWMQWLLPDFPKLHIAAHATRLTRLWRDSDGRRVARQGTAQTLAELVRRGYKLGIIANTITETEIPDWMVEDGVAPYFTTVILSSKVRIRKPDPAIYLLAARCIDSKPENCAYIGDNPSRDVEGTRASGYGLMVRVDEPDTLAKEPPTAECIPDHIIREIPEVLDIFQGIQKGR